MHVPVGGLSELHYIMKFMRKVLKGLKLIDPLFAQVVGVAKQLSIKAVERKASQSVELTCISRHSREEKESPGMKTQSI